jgi:hypothetical protein
VNFNNLNSVFTKVTQVAIVANLIEAKYKDYDYFIRVFWLRVHGAEAFHPGSLLS